MYSHEGGPRAGSRLLYFRRLDTDDQIARKNMFNIYEHSDACFRKYERNEHEQPPPDQCGCYADLVWLRDTIKAVREKLMEATLKNFDGLKISHGANKSESFSQE